MNTNQLLPVLPIYHLVMLPGVHTTLQLPKATYEAYVEQGKPETFILLPTKTEKSQSISDFQNVGILCTAEKLFDKKERKSLLLQCLDKVSVTQLIHTDAGFMAGFSIIYEEQDVSERSYLEMLEYMKKAVREIAGNIRGGDYFVKGMEHIDQINTLIVYLAGYMHLSEEERYELMETNSIKERALTFIDYLMRQKQLIALNVQMNEKFTEQANEAYRQQALRQQLKAIQHELGDDTKSKGKEQSYKERIEAANLPTNIEEALLEEADKLENEGSQGMEANQIRSYLDFALALPWAKEESKDISLQKAKEILDQDHCGLETVKERILSHLAVMQLKKGQKGSVLLLVGPPGTGKTSLGKSIAKALDRPYVRMALGGMRDESEIRGHRRTYVGAMAGRVLKSMKEAGKSNPVFVLDEIDKVKDGGFSGDPQAALLEVLDPNQNDTFTDHYLDLPYDLSDCFFICTANSLDGISAPLLDRMEVIQISGYTPTEKMQIAKEHLIPMVLEENGITNAQFMIQDEALASIIENYTAEAGVRGLKKQLAKLARNAATTVVMHPEELPVIVDEAKLESQLKTKVRHHEKAGISNPPGVVTGLAWTAVGGEILFIETTAMPGNGGLILTGQLGDVMKESAQISLSLLKSRLPMNTSVFANKDIHIHVPSGSTPKDGPSAGITLFTALASLVTGMPVDSHLAMTGEITLRGEVCAIGGLKEKLYGAQRAGITKVLIPYDNRSDLDDIPQEIKDSLEIIPVQTVEDVLEHALHIHLPRLEQVLYTPEEAMNFSVK
jgi:ATP-dependent Lon protease